MSILDITRGDDTVLRIAVTDSDTGDPVDLTDADLWWLMKRRADDEDNDALLTKTSADGIAIGDPTGGLATITIAAADTDDLDPGLYPWELQGRLGGAIRTLAGGRIRIVADLVRTTMI